MSLITKIKERQKEANLKLLKISLYNKFKEQIDLYQKKIITKNSDIESYIKRIAVDQRDIENFSRYTKTLQQQLKDLDKKMAGIYDQLKALERGLMFKQINICDDKIEAFTNLIKIKHNHSVYQIGEFRIDLDFRGTVKMHNLTNKIGTNDHPHISDGNVCWGNAAEQVGKLIGKSQFREVLKLCYEFLISPTVGHAYREITDWKKET